MHHVGQPLLPRVRWLVLLVFAFSLFTGSSASARAVPIAGKRAPTARVALDGLTVDALPASPQIVGTNVTFTAHAASNAYVVRRSVTFQFTGATTATTPSIPLTQDAQQNGVATYQTTTLAVGITNVVVHFTSASFNNADSTPIAYTITSCHWYDNQQHHNPRLIRDVIVGVNVVRGFRRQRNLHRDSSRWLRRDEPADAYRQCPLL